ncbi:MAG: hypothetical protein GF353_24990 [Candidatus Lokiarchaeota archaeon]|nr:hypothetical protein [Candidatus Lokiarchaeota archaeon]
MSERHNFEEFKLPLTQEMVSYYERRRPPPGPRRGYGERSQFVSEVIETFDREIRPTTLSPQLINPELIFRLNSSEASYLDLKDLEGPCGFKILSTDYDKTAVLFGEEEDGETSICSLKDVGKEEFYLSGVSCYETFIRIFI